MVPGMIKPIIDQINAALVAAQRSITTMLTCMMPPAIAGGSGSGSNPSTPGADEGGTKPKKGDEDTDDEAQKATTSSTAETTTTGPRLTASTISSGQNLGDSGASTTMSAADVTLPHADQSKDAQNGSSCDRRKKLKDGSTATISFVELPWHCLTPTEQHTVLSLTQPLPYSGSSFVEVDSSTDTRARPDGEKSGDMIKTFQKSYFTKLEGSLTGSLSVDLTESLSVELQELLHSRLAQELEESLKISLSHSVHHFVSTAVGVAVTHGTSTALTRMLPRFIMDAVKTTLSQTMTRALTHSVGSAVIESLLHGNHLYATPSKSEEGTSTSHSTAATVRRDDERNFHCYTCQHNRNTVPG